MWTQLLWKDARQTFPVAAICLVTVIVIQLLARFQFIQPVMLDFDVASVMTTVGPILVALACVSMSIGLERQSRIMNWLSTLPVPWWRTMISQTLVALIYIGVAITTTQIAGQMGSFRDIVPIDHLSPFAHTTNGGFVACFAIEIFVLAAIYFLIFDDLSPALVASGLTTLAINFVVLGIFSTESPIHASTYPYQLYASMIAVSLACLAAVCLIRLYQWRWQIGQYASVARASTPSWLPILEYQLRPIPIHWKGIQAARPFTTVLLDTIQRSSVLYWFAIIFLPFIIPLAYIRQWYEYPLHAATLLAITGGVSGLLCFASEHSKSRIRFLADRGIGASTIYWGRTLPTLSIILAQLIVIFFLWIFLSIRAHNIVPYIGAFGPLTIIAIYFLAQLSGLCIPNLLIAMCGATAITVLMFQLFNYPYAYRFNSMEDYGLTSLQLFLWIVCVILISVRWIVPRWLLRQTSGSQRLIAYVLTTTLLPLVLFTIVGLTAYWSIPDPDWKKLETLAGRTISVPTKSWVELNLEGPTVEPSILLGRYLGVQRTTSEGIRQYYPFYSWQNVDAWESQNKRYGLTDEQRQDALDWLDQLHSSIAKVKPSFEHFDRNKFILGRATHSSIAYYTFQCQLLIHLSKFFHDQTLLKRSVEGLLDVQSLQKALDPYSLITLRSHTMGMWESWSEEDLRWMDEIIPLDFVLDDPVSLEEYRRWFAEQAVVYSAAYYGKLDKELSQNKELGRYYHLRADFIHSGESNWNLFMLPVAVGDRYRTWTFVSAAITHLELLDKETFKSKDDPQFGRELIEFYAMTMPVSELVDPAYYSYYMNMYVEQEYIHSLKSRVRRARDGRK